MMRRKPAQAVWIATFPCLRTIGNPDTLPVEIYLAERSAASGLLWASSSEKRSVEHAQFHMPGGVRYCNGKQACVFVVYTAQFHAVPMGIGCEPETVPVKEVVRLGQCDPWSPIRKRGVRHDVALEWLHVCDAWIFTPATTGTTLVISFGLQCNAKPFGAYWIAICIEPHSCYANARIIPFGDQPREQIELPIRATRGCRIQDSFDFIRISA